MAFDGGCDVGEHHGLHRFGAAFQEAALPVDDLGGHLEQRFVAQFQTFEEQLGVLQVFSEVLVFRAAVAAFHEARVVVLQAQPWRRRLAVQGDRPTPVLAAHHHVRLHVFHVAFAEGGAGARVERLEQRHHGKQFVLVELGAPRQCAEVAAGEQLEVALHEVDGAVPLGRVFG